MESEFKYVCVFCGIAKRAERPGEACLRCETRLAKATDGPALEQHEQPRRHCRQCRAPLPPSRYFYCNNDQSGVNACHPEARMDAFARRQIGVAI